MKKILPPSFLLIVFAFVTFIVPHATPVSHTVVFVDPSVPDASYFEQHAERGSRVIMLDAAKDGLQQISDALQKESNITSIHIVSHGSPGHIYLGSSDIDTATLTSKNTLLSSWKKQLSTSAQIALYGCDVAEGQEGKKFVETLAALTHTDVAASTDVSGGKSTIGNWTLEMHTGHTSPLLAFDQSTLARYPYTLNHFRYGTMNWSLLSDKQVLIKIENDWTNNHGFIPTNTAIGGVLINKFTVNFGDGNTANVALRVTSRDAANNDVLTEVVSQSGASYISGIKHTYATNGNYTVSWTSSAREVANSQTNSVWRSEMTVNIGNGNSSPVVAVPAVVQVYDNEVFHYSLVAVDPNGDQLQYRLGTQQEFYNNNNNSATTPPTGLTLSSTGAITWDVRNTTLSTNVGDRWQMTAMVEDLTSTGAVKSKVPIDFVFVISNTRPAVFELFPLGTQVAPVGQTKDVTMSVQDPNWHTGYASPTITALNPPSTDPSVWTGSIVRSSSGATYTTHFTPTIGMAGQTFVVIYRATNSSGATAVQPVTFLVPGANQAPSNITLSNNDAVEHSPVNTVIGTLSVSDIDPGDTHTLTLTGSTNMGIFKLGGGSGDQLQLASASLSNSGTYTVTVRATDSGNLFLDKSFTIKLWLDVDGDLIADYHDSLIGNKTYPTSTGVSDLKVKVSGSDANGTYTGSQTTLFTDGSTDLFSFVPDYNSTTIHLANVLVKRGTNSLVVNMGNELPSGTKKTLYLDNNNFVSLCVKDADITSDAEISSDCTGLDETDFTSCIGNSGGVTINGLTCTDEGTRFRVDGLTHSGIMGKPAPTPPANNSNSGESGGGGGGGGSGGNRNNISAMVLASSYQQQATHAASPNTSATDCSTKNLFKDVQEGAWYAYDVCILKRAGVVSGYKDKQGVDLQVYRPMNNVSYAEIAKMALLSSGKKPDASGSPINTSAQGDWSTAYIHAMEVLKIPTYSSALDVHSPALREDVVDILWRVFDLPVTNHTSSSFTDLSMKSPFADTLLSAVDLKILQGDTSLAGDLLHTIRPTAPIDRAEVAKIFFLVMQYAAAHK